MSFTGTQVEKVIQTNPNLTDPQQIADLLIEVSPANVRAKILREILPDTVRRILDQNAAEAEAPPTRRPSQPRGTGSHAARRVRTWREKVLATSIQLPDGTRRPYGELTLADCRALVQDYRQAAEENLEIAARFERFARTLQRRDALRLADLGEREFEKSYGDQEAAVA